jgi:4-hydroxy-L-threonine phosphate dehydrogenase PdxA
MSKSANAEYAAPPILITMGEPSGIGPEIALAAFDQLGGKIGQYPLKLVGDASVFPGHSAALIATKAKVKAAPMPPP